jgi:hypothetical protein
MRAFLTCFLLAAAFLAANQAKSHRDPDTTGYGKSQILNILLSRFQDRNPKIGFVELYDIRPLFLNPPYPWPKTNRYLVLARGVRSDFNFEGTWEDELFGLFVFDNSLSSITRTVAIIPSKRWCDYMVRIVEVSKDSVTVHGNGMTYDDQEFDARFHLHK